MLQRTGRWRNGQSGGLGTASLFEALRCAMIANKGSYLDFNFLVLLASILQRAGCLLSMQQDVVGPAPSPPFSIHPFSRQIGKTLTQSTDALVRPRWLTMPLNIGRGVESDTLIRFVMNLLWSNQPLSRVPHSPALNVERIDAPERIRCEPHAVGGLVW